MKKLSLYQWIAVGIVPVIIVWFFVSGGVTSLFSNPNASKINNNKTMTNKNTMDSTNPTNPTNTTGLVIEDTIVGAGAIAVAGKSITANYTGMLQNGTVFDSSLNAGRTPFSFTLGAGQVIKGWDKGIEGMKVGGKRRLIIAPEMAYGTAGIKGPDGRVVIPENATLIFDVELLGVK